MCGICGIFTERPADRAILEDATSRMTGSLAHRGPDDGGVWVDPAGRVALGNRRLAIIDLSPGGHQPMTDPREEVCLSMNGEIYNFRQLRRELAEGGYRFRGHSDTEVVLALYLRDGQDAFRHLRGMFALAAWDGRTQQLLLARDRLGIKPLFYATNSGRWVFASEIRAIRASGLVPARLDPLALAAYLRLGSVPSPMTAFEGVNELPPATILVLRDGRTTLARYWELPAPRPELAEPEVAIHEIRERFREAVTTHLVSDVPLGVFLSGGVDSAAIVAMMREAGHARIRTFSITFPEDAYDEGPEAASVARQYGTDHTAWEVRGEDLAADLDQVFAAMDQPTVDGVNTYFVSRATRESGTIVALSGLGGDELFCGYPSFRLAPRLLAWQQMVARLSIARPALAAALGVIPTPRSAKLKESLIQPPSIRGAYLAVRGMFSQAEVTRLLAPGPVADAARGVNAAEALSALAPALPNDPVAATAVLELRGYMHNQLLRDTDVMSMAHGLEVRVPFLDHPLVEFAVGLPGRLRGNGHPPKWLFLEALKDVLPPHVWRPKRGFTFPLGPWLKGSLRPRVDEALRDGGGIFWPPAVADIRERVKAGQVHWSRLWTLVALILWLRSIGERLE